MTFLLRELNGDSKLWYGEINKKMLYLGYDKVHGWFFRKSFSYWNRKKQEKYNEIYNSQLLPYFYISLIRVLLYCPDHFHI